MNQVRLLSELAKTGHVRKLKPVELHPGMQQRNPPWPPAAPERLRPYQIAIKPADDSWPLADDRNIRRARAAHNSGKFSLTQRTDKGWTRLFLLPVVPAVAPRDYFPPEML